jgi:two-component system, NtrC family, response regulator
VIERSVIFCDEGFIGIDHLPEYMRPAKDISNVSSGHGSLKDAVRSFERQFIQQTLVTYKQNKEEAAKVLGVSLSSLYRKIEELQIHTR